MARKADVRDYVSRAEGMLRSRGSYSMPNDEPGLAHAVYEELRRMFPNCHLTYDKPSFGGFAEFKSDDHLGFEGVGQ